MQRRRYLPIAAFAAVFVLLGTVVVARLWLNPPTHCVASTPTVTVTPTSVTGVVLGTPSTPNPADVTALPNGSYQVTAVILDKGYVGAQSGHGSPAILTSEGDFGTSQAVWDKLTKGEAFTLAYHLREAPLVPFIDSASALEAAATKNC